MTLAQQTAARSTQDHDSQPFFVLLKLHATGLGRQVED
jgi:hypothetical protein